MARIRTIKPEFWTSEQVMECKAITRLLFVGMWNFADDKGRMTFSPKKIKAQVFPGDDDVTSENVRGMIHELSSHGLIQLYSVDGNEFIQITGWAKHQRIDKPQPSNIPAPNEGISLGEARDSKIIPGMIAERSATEGNGREGIGKEEEPLSEKISDEAGILEVEKPKKAKAAYPDDYLKFWAGYPTDPLMSKKDAYAVWKRLDDADRAMAMRGIAGLVEHQRKNPTYRMVHACRYLSQRRFEGLASADNIIPIIPTFNSPEEWAEQLRARHAGKAS